MVNDVAHRIFTLTEETSHIDPQGGVPDTQGGAPAPEGGQPAPKTDVAKSAGAAAHCEACSRRSFLYLATTATGVAGVGAAVWPLADQMNPTASVEADATREIDISAIKPGLEQVFSWRGHPLVVRHRTKAEIASARAVPVSALLDGKARNANLDANAPATDQNRVIKPEWLVLIGVCTHLGCSPAPSTPDAPLGNYGGWVCQCHGSQFDTSGRVRTGPAAQNLFIPRYAFVSDKVIRVG